MMRRSFGLPCSASKIKIADRMLVVLFAVDAQQRRAGLIDQALASPAKASARFLELLPSFDAENIGARVEQTRRPHQILRRRQRQRRAQPLFLKRPVHAGAPVDRAAQPLRFGVRQLWPPSSRRSCRPCRRSVCRRYRCGFRDNPSPRRKFARRWAPGPSKDSRPAPGISMVKQAMPNLSRTSLLVRRSSFQPSTPPQCITTGGRLTPFGTCR